MGHPSAADGTMDAPPARDARPPASGLGRILFLAVAYAVVYSSTLSVLSQSLAVAGARDWSIQYSAIYGWLLTLAVFPGGILADRFFGARRAVIVGAWFAGAASLAVLAVAYVARVALSEPFDVAGLLVVLPLACIALALSVLGAGLLRANLAVVLSDWHPVGSDRRYPAFIWFEALTGVAFLVPESVRRVGGTVEMILGVGLVIFAAAAVVFARYDASRRPRTDGADGLTLSPGGSLRLAGLTFLVILACGVAILRNAGGESTPVSIIVAVLCVGIPVFIYSKMRRHATGVSQLVNVRTIGVLLVAAFAFFAFGDFAAINDSNARKSVAPVPRTYETLVSFAGTAFAVIIGLTWRRLRRDVAEASRIGFSLGFTLVAGTFVLIAAVLASRANVYSLLIVVAAWETASTLVSATALHAATALAPAGFAARAVACWRLVVSSAYTWMAVAVPLDTEPDPIMAAAAAASCLWLALVLLPRHASSTADRGLRRRGLATRVAAVAAVGSIGWAVMGRYMDSDVTAFAVAGPPRFHGADRAFLPDDATFGFVAISGSAAAGVTPTNPAAPRDVGSEAIAVPLSPFSIARYEVTVAQYRACADDGGCSPTDPRATAGEDTSPVRYVTWLEALDYCRWLEKRLAAFSPSLLANGEHVTLPSEAEWEFAAGRGVGTYPWNGPLTPLRANYANAGHLLPASVGEFGAGATADGIQDLSGNVAEWTRSEYRPYPYDRTDGRENMDTATRPRVIRGGSFYDAATLLTVTSRQAADPDRGYDFVGFRTALSAVATAAPPPAAPPATTK